MKGGIIDFMQSLKNKRGQGGGLVTGLVFGIAGLVIGVIIAFVIISTLVDANLLSGVEQGAVGNMSANFTDGIDEVSAQLPTILLIAAIVLVLGVLAVLVGVWQRMRMGGGSL